MFYLTETNVFIIGFFVMLFFSLWFFINRNKNKLFSLAFLVTSVTTLSYLLMLEGTFKSISSSGQAIYFTRWLFYILSCSLLMLTIAKFLKVSKNNTIGVLVLNTLVMLTGALAAILAPPFNYLIFSLGMIFFIGQLILLFDNKASKQKNNLIKYYIFFGWTMFPVVFLISPAGIGLINTLPVICLYFLLDIFTKIIFYFSVNKY
jgi:bacteriorhodopsin